MEDMKTQRLKADLEITPEILEKEINLYKAKLRSYKETISKLPYKYQYEAYYREVYVDNGQESEPYYILEFVSGDRIEEIGDELYHEPLWYNVIPGVRLKSLTRGRQIDDEKQYWKPISISSLIETLDHFLEMYKENYLQPPGYRGDDIRADLPHEKLKVDKYLYRISSGIREIIGVGPKKVFVVVTQDSAMRGRLITETGEPLKGAIIQLISNNNIVAQRTSDNDGNFWFSKVKSGKYKLKIKNKLGKIKDLVIEEFGNVDGKLLDTNKTPLSNQKVNFIAPDDEVFQFTTNKTGELSDVSLPAFDYEITIPGQTIKRMKDPYRDKGSKHTSMSGSITDEQGNPVPNVKVVLYKDDLEFASYITDAKGNFQFVDLPVGQYKIMTEGYLMIKTTLE